MQEKLIILFCLSLQLGFAQNPQDAAKYQSYLESTEYIKSCIREQKQCPDLDSRIYNLLIKWPKTIPQENKRVFAELYFKLYDDNSRYFVDVFEEYSALSNGFSEDLVLEKVSSIQTFNSIKRRFGGIAQLGEPIDIRTHSAGDTSFFICNNCLNDSLQLTTVLPPTIELVEYSTPDSIGVVTSHSYKLMLHFQDYGLDWRKKEFELLPKSTPATTTAKNISGKQNLQESQNDTFPWGWILLILLLPLGYFVNKIRKKEDSDEEIAIEPIIDMTTSEQEKTIVINQVSKVQDPPTQQTTSASYANSIDMNVLWESTLVSSLKLSDEFVHNLNEYINKKSRHDETKMIHEIGGFILGTFSKINENAYTITLDKLVEIEGGDQSSQYSLEFDSRAWAALDEAMNDNGENSGYSLIGWFHTHPGHGVFLSRPDINISENFFDKPYQIALEIDNIISENNLGMEVGIFSQKELGVYNNTKDLIGKWPDWLQILRDSKLKDQYPKS